MEYSFGRNVNYNQLSPDEQIRADRVVCFTYDLLDLWDKTITAKFEPTLIEYMVYPNTSDGSYKEEIYNASWVLEFKDAVSGKSGGTSLRIELEYLDDPKFRQHLFNQIVLDYARLIYSNEGVETGPAEQR